MKKINKEPSPAWFETWKQTFRNLNGRKANYKDDFAPNDPAGNMRRIRLRKSLVEEQGYICCYCMKRIFVEDSHIEHFWPKDEFDKIDLEYGNLFASCNGDGVIEMDDYCGHKKNNWYSESMIAPTDSEVERMFMYSMDGRIHPTSRRSTSNAAQEMINNLGLNSFHLERARRDAIQASEVYDEDEYTEEEIRSFIDFYLHKDNGKYVPYCKAITDCLSELL